MFTIDFKAHYLLNTEVEYNDRQEDIIDLSYLQLDMVDKFLTYDWIERADESVTEYYE